MIESGFKSRASYNGDILEPFHFFCRARPILNLMRETTATPYESAIPDITLPEAIKLETLLTPTSSATARMTKTTPITTPTTQITTTITKTKTTTVNWQFNCTDGNWINSKWVCDGNQDCEDNSDELNCDPNENENEYKFYCTNGDWTNKRFLCDGQPDCSDGSDEMNCMIETTKMISTTRPFQPEIVPENTIPSEILAIDIIPVTITPNKTIPVIKSTSISTITTTSTTTTQSKIFSIKDVVQYNRWKQKMPTWGVGFRILKNV